MDRRRFLPAPMAEVLVAPIAVGAQAREKIARRRRGQETRDYRARERTTNAVALQFKHSPTCDSARRSASSIWTVFRTSVSSRAVTAARQGKQINFPL
jgi:hypothetical protein